MLNSFENIERANGVHYRIPASDLEDASSGEVPGASVNVLSECRAKAVARMYRRRMLHANQDRCSLAAEELQHIGLPDSPCGDAKRTPPIT